MTPMIDVVFLLLIFFVCTASFQPAEALLPGDLLISGPGLMDVQVEEEPRLERIVIRIQSGGWLVNESRCNDQAELRTLLATLAKIDQTLPVVVDPDSDVPLGTAIDGYDAARAVGFRDVKFAAAVE